MLSFTFSLKTNLPIKKWKIDQAKVVLLGSKVTARLNKDQTVKSLWNVCLLECTFLFVRIFNLYTCQIKRFFMLAEPRTLVHCGYRGVQPLILISTKKEFPVPSSDCFIWISSTLHCRYDFYAEYWIRIKLIWKS